MSANPLLEAHGLPPFSTIEPGHVEPAVRYLIERNKSRIEELLASNERHSWDSLLRPIEEMEDELGDLLFVVTNLARQLKLDPARALRRANAKFELRFRAVEDAAGDHDTLEAMSLEQMEELWQQVKLHHRKEGME